MTPLDFALGVARLFLQMLGTYTATLLILDQVCWTYRRYWRYLGTALVTFLVTGLLAW